MGLTAAFPMQENEERRDRARAEGRAAEVEAEVEAILVQEADRDRGPALTGPEGVVGAEVVPVGQGAADGLALRLPGVLALRRVLSKG